jgi:hypothetical protein
MAKRRLAEHFREVCCGSADLSPPRARDTVFTLFWCCLAPAAGSTAYCEMLMYPSIFG